MKDEEIKEQLMSSNYDFRRLAEAHHLYEGRLQEMHRRPHMTEKDHLDEVALKKKKLQLKDQMNSMISKLTSGLGRQPS